MVSGAMLSPSAASSLISNVPLVTAMGPVKAVFTPKSANVPGPSTVSAPAPDTGPARMWLAPLGVISVSVPVVTATAPVYAAGDVTVAAASKVARSFVSAGTPAGDQLAESLHKPLDAAPVQRYSVACNNPMGKTIRTIQSRYSPRFLFMCYPLPVALL